MDQQQVDNLEMRLTRIENQLTHILFMLLRIEPDSHEISVATGNVSGTEVRITGITTNRSVTPNIGGKHPFQSP